MVIEIILNNRFQFGKSLDTDHKRLGHFNKKYFHLTQNMGQGESTEQEQPHYTEEEKQRIYKSNPWLAGVAGMYLTKKAVEYNNPVVRVAVSEPLEELGNHSENFARKAWDLFWSGFGLIEKATDAADSGVHAVGEGLDGATWLLNNHILLYAIGAIVAYKVIKWRRSA